MIYTFGEYAEMGGELEETAFNKYVDRACGIIEAATFSRVDSFEELPQKVKACARDLIDRLSEQLANVQSKSQSAGSVSESVTFKDSEAQQEEIESMLKDYLSRIETSNGVPLLFRGVG